MKHLIRTLVLFVVAAGALVVPLSIYAEAELTYDMAQVNHFGTQDAIDDAFSVLVRNGDEVSMMIHTSDLVPGEALTAWWVIFNNPAACSDGVCNGDDLPQNGGAPEVEAAMIWADGQVVDVDGVAQFTARLSADDTSNAYAFETQGLTNVETAEIHMVVRTHGSALEDSELLEAQLTTLNGGCENGSEVSGLPGPNTCTNIQSAIFIADV